MTNPGVKYDAAANNQRMFEENKRLREVTGDLGERLTDAVNTIARLRWVLARLEWVEDIQDTSPTCPACYQFKSLGHDPNCWLAAELRVQDQRR